MVAPDVPAFAAVASRLAERRVPSGPHATRNR